MFGLCVRFTCRDQASAEAYDRLVAETVEAIRANEPGTLVYASHLVGGSRYSGSSTSCIGTRQPSMRTRPRRTPATIWMRGTSTWPAPRSTG